MGPVLRVPDDVARRLEAETDLVEEIVEPDVIDVPDLELGPPGGSFLVLVEVPNDRFGDLVPFFAASHYAAERPDPCLLVVRDHKMEPHSFPAGPVTEAGIRAHLAAFAAYGEPGDRRPLLVDAAR